MTDVYAREQSPRMSMVEAITNVAVGFGLAVAINAIVLPWFGLAPTMADNFAIAGVFTGVSLVRAFALRRLFEAHR